MSPIKHSIPIIILLALLLILGRELFYAKPNELPSTLIGENVPSFQLPTLQSPQTMLTQAQLKGRITLLNVWATWCYACSIEHPMLKKIQSQYHIPIYAIDYKDDPKAAITWLRKHGNPYVMIGNDIKGDVAIDFGIYGTPETFVISPDGKIIYRHVGIIDQKVWDEVLYPLIKKYEHAP